MKRLTHNPNVDRARRHLKFEHIVIKKKYFFISTLLEKFNLTSSDLVAVNEQHYRVRH